ncbi:PQQ-dependent sugar dehydrogenase [Spirosoma areae]
MIKTLFHSLSLLVGFTLLFSLSAWQIRPGDDEKTPEESRFSKVVLAENLDEPMELAVLKDGTVLFIERKGKLLAYDPKTAKIRQVASLNVHTKHEDGLLGMTLDLNFDKNQWIYLFYSPAGDVAQQYVSRFVFDGASVDPASEKVLLKIPTDREECCHSGGSLTFGNDGNLYISTGDNTSPFGSNYYAPLDERQGRKSWDAQRSAGNTNDLRGKILRIHPEADGTYTIPDGNLFPTATPKTRPEIYVMGCRNPFRISVDAKRGYLYWGDVGQNGEKDSERGPRSWDEWNVAKTAGNFGWPYFAGNNRPYAAYDFASDKAGAFFDPQNPVNRSVNNTGLAELPPAQPAFIWYNYAESDVFPHLGTGGKSPMAGPVYYADSYRNSDRKFPAYYDGKLFIFEWLRDWIDVATLKADGSLDRIEPFMPHTEFAHPIDLDFGPDGAMYVLEYGTYWFSQNANARLSRVDYAEGNRPPVAKARANKTVGAAPLTVQFSANGSFDYDKNDPLSYQWFFDTKSGVSQSSEKDPSYTFKKPGVYSVVLNVSDAHQKTSTATVSVKVGNEAPTVALNWTANKSFYWPDQQTPYRVLIADKEDRLTGGINPKKAVVQFEYIPYGEDITLAAQNYESAVSSTRLSAGQKLMNESDCKACHGLDKKSIGPAYLDVAKRYKGNTQATATLAAKIIKGGNGNWGENAMSAHPQLTLDQTTEMVRYILSLADAPSTTPSLPLTGTVAMTGHSRDKAPGNYLMTVSYTDKGANGVGPVTTRTDILLRPPVVEATRCDSSSKVSILKSAAENQIKFTANGAFAVFKAIDLTGIKAVTFQLPSSPVTGELTLHLDSPTGPVIGRADILTAARAERYTTPVGATAGRHTLFLVYKDSKGNATMWSAPSLSLITFHNSAH